MTLFPNYHRRALEQDGYVVYAPDEPQPLPIPNLPSAIAFVRASGYAVIQAKTPQPPQVGSCWVPMRGRGSAYPCSQAHRRYVRSVGVDAMSYTTTPDGLPTAISVRSWIRWVQRTRAVVS